MEYLPDFVQLEIIHPAYLKFCLPVTAFGIQDDMIMEISVEYMLSEDQAVYMANVWVRTKGSKSKRFLYAPAVPVKENAGECIVTYLNEDPVFVRLMSNYVCEAAKHRFD